MQHFFVTPRQVQGKEIYIEGSDVNHMRNVLRLRPGEKVMVSDGYNRSYLCRIRAYEDGRALLSIEEEQETQTELSSRIYLFQGLPKSDKMEWIIQKAVELGAYEIVPVATRRTVVKWDEKKAARKAERWNEVARSAAKQSGRGRIPKVLQAMDYRDALEYAKELDVLLIPYELARGMEHTRQVLKSILPGQSVGIFIGPEGGFEKEEIERARNAGAAEITLGNRILRTETAGIAALSILMYHLET